MKWIKLGKRYYVFGVERIPNLLGYTYAIGFGLGILIVYDLGQKFDRYTYIEGIEIDFWPRKNIVFGDMPFSYNKQVFMRCVSPLRIRYNASN